MAARRFATVDVGTNTTLLLAAEVDDQGGVTVLEDRAEITRLGRGIGLDGRLGPEGLARTLDVLRAYGEAARRHGCAVLAVGTEALRRAPNRDDFLGPAAEALGAPVEVIDGDREAALTFLAAARSFPAAAAGAMAVIDIGGGSTEFILSIGERIGFRRSLPLGSVRLTERFIRSDPARPEELAALEAEVSAHIAAVPFEAAANNNRGQPPVLVGIAGTVTTLAAMALALDTYDPDRVHGYRLGADALDAEVTRLARSTQAERERIPGLDPRRADVILAGACLLRAIVRRAAAPSVLVSDRGIRWGLLFEAADARP